MTTPNPAEPVAIPQSPEPPAVPVPTQPSFAEVAAGKNAPPPAQNGNVPDDVAMQMFSKIAAERRERESEAPITIPFGNGVIRIHRTMPAGFVFDAASAEVDPYAAKRMLRAAIIPEDHDRLDYVMTLPPNNPEGIDGVYLVGFLEALSELYTGVPLGVRSR